MALSTDVGAKIDEFLNSGFEEIMEEKLKLACAVIEGNAKSRCPVDTGRLRNSITYKVEGLEGAVGTNVVYAPYMEVGTGIYASAGNGRKSPWVYKKLDGTFVKTNGNKPTHFLENGANASKSQIIKLFEGAI